MKVLTLDGSLLMCLCFGGYSAVITQTYNLSSQTVHSHSGIDFDNEPGILFDIAVNQYDNTQGTLVSAAFSNYSILELWELLEGREL